MACYVIFGAAVKPGGVPSGSLLRRIEGALQSSQNDPNPRFLATGGLGKHPPTEAEVMSQVLIENGVNPESIIKDPTSTDTLESAKACGKIIRDQKLSNVVICTDRYHMFRCKMLFALLGISSKYGNVGPSKTALGWKKWLLYNVKEIIATPYDMILLLLSK